MATEIYVNGERVTPDQIESALARQAFANKSKEVQEAVLAERESCAKLAEALYRKLEPFGFAEIQLIRAGWGAIIAANIRERR